jgi:predicted DNA binding protein
MPHAKLTISVPDDVWIGEVSRAYPCTSFRVIAATADESRGVARIDIMGPDAAEICEVIPEYDAVTDLTIFKRSENVRSVQIETTVPLLMQALQKSGVPLDMPVEIADGTLSLEAAIPQRSLSALGETLDAVGIDYTVESIRQEIESESLLTDRQRWLLDEAIEHGYYDTPRRTSLVELAEELDLAKSTCSEMLHRVEERVLKAYLHEEESNGPSLVASAD